jgi:uncharacterized RDD family membrane protein YckC
MNTFLPQTAGPPDDAGDKLTIETPEQTSLEFAVAGIGSRFLAMAIDSLIQGAALAILFSAGLFLAGALPTSFAPAGPWIVAIGLLAGFTIFLGYFIFFEAIWHGQTPGKRIIHIRVIKDDGRPVQAVESFGRNLMRIVDQLPFLYAIGVASVLLSRRSQRLGDFVAGTIVVHERMLQDIKPLWNAAPSESGLRLGAERLTGEELALIETFLNRRGALAADVRYNMAEQIVRRIESNLTLPPPGTLSNEKLLEAVASERRSSAKYA